MFQIRVCDAGKTHRPMELQRMMGGRGSGGSGGSAGDNGGPRSGLAADCCVNGGGAKPGLSATISATLTTHVNNVARANSFSSEGTKLAASTRTNGKRFR